MIELDNDSYIVGMWFSNNPITNDDWMACVISDPDRPKMFKGWSRFRITKDSKIWNSSDEKKWTYFESKEGQTEQYMIETMNEMQNRLKCMYTITDKIIVEGDLQKLIELSKDKDWLNINKGEHLKKD